MFFNLIPCKIIPIHICVYIHHKRLNIFIIIVLTGFLCVLLSSQFLKSFVNLNIKNQESGTIMTIAATLKQTQLLRPSPKMIHTATTEYPLQNKLKRILKCRNNKLIMGKYKYGKYRLLKNYIRGRKSSQIGCAGSITFTSHGDFTFMKHLANVVKR